MQLTRFTDFGLRILTYLALLPRDEIANISDVTEQYGLSRNHVVKIVHALGKGGFLETVRGKGGGIRLQRPPEQINLGEVIEFLEPNLDVVDCHSPLCKLNKICQLYPILDEATEAFMGVLYQHYYC